MRILAVGKYDNALQEQALGSPILTELARAGHQVIRVGEQFDFFNPKNFTQQVADWVAGVPLSLEGYDIVFLLDWWSPVVPLLCYRMSVLPTRPKMIGLFLGSTRLEGDLAREIPFAAEYEDYLFTAFDLIICNVDWARELLPASAKTVTCPFPLEALEVLPMSRPKKRVYYLQRWAYDKAPERFQAFAKLAEQSGIECYANASERDSFGPDDPIRYIGWQTVEELKALGQEGGYIWGHARQELFGYAISNMILYGLTPLVSNSRGYNGLKLPDEYRFTSSENAIDKVNAGLVMTDADRSSWLKQHKDNARRIAEEILHVGNAS
jgi:hypothetical protein